MSPQVALSKALQGEGLRARCTIGLLVGTIVLDVVSFALLSSQASLLYHASVGETVSQAEAAANDARVALVGQLSLALFVVTAISFLMWFYSAYRNLSLVGSRKTKLSAGSATGDWFIPFLNLVRPYRNVAELWHRTQNQNRLESVADLSAPGVVLWWWLTFLSANLIAQFASSQSTSDRSLKGLSAMTDWFMAYHFVHVAAAVLAIMLVLAIHEGQRHFEGVAPPPPLSSP